MNKSKIIIPLATVLFALTSCGGVKTKKVKTIWGNTWKYTNTVCVGFENNDRQYIKEHENDIDWEKTKITTGYGSDTYQEGDQTANKIFSAEFIRTCDAKKYPDVAKQRDFFSKNKIVVSKKEDKTITIGETKYTDAEEANGVETIYFNSETSRLQSSCDNDGIIEQLDVYHAIDGYTYSSKISINVFFKGESNSADNIIGKGYFEIAALA